MQGKLETLSDYREIAGIGDLNPSSNRSIDGESDGEFVPGFKAVRLCLCIPRHGPVEELVRGVVELFPCVTEKTTGVNWKGGKEIERGLPMSRIQLDIFGYGQVHDGADPGGYKCLKSCGSGEILSTLRCRSMTRLGGRVQALLLSIDGCKVRQGSRPSRIRLSPGRS